MLNLLADGGLLAEGAAPAPPAPHNNFGDTMSNGIAGPLALLIIVLLALATVFLIRNMNSRLRRLPAQFPPPAGGPVARGAAIGDAGGAASGPAPTTDGSGATGGSGAAGSGPDTRGTGPDDVAGDTSVVGDDTVPGGGRDGAAGASGTPAGGPDGATRRTPADGSPGSDGR